MDLARDGEKKQSNTKKSGPKKEVFIDISSTMKKSSEKDNAATNTQLQRQEKKKAKAKDTFKSKFESRIVSALDYYQKKLEEYKSVDRSNNRKTKNDSSQKDENQNVENNAPAVDNKTTQSTQCRLSSKQVVDALIKFQGYTEDEQKEQENEVYDLEMNMDLSDFHHESEWTIEMTEEAHKWFRKHIKRQNDFCQRVIRRLKILSTGRWPYVLCKSLKTKKSNAQLYESKIDSGSRILWEVAISFSPRRSSAGSPIYEQ